MASTIFTSTVAWYAVLVSAMSTAARLQAPVTTRTMKAGQATRANARAMGLRASGAAARTVGTSPARVS